MAKEEHVNIRKFPFWKRKEKVSFVNEFVYVEKSLNEINKMASSQDESDVFDNWEDLDKTEVIQCYLIILQQNVVITLKLIAVSGNLQIV